MLRNRSSRAKYQLHLEWQFLLFLLLWSLLFLIFFLTFMVPSVSDIFGNDGHHVACVDATQGHQLGMGGEAKSEI